MTTVSARPATPASPTATRPGPRWAMAVVWASWPAGFLLIMAHTLGGLLSTTVFALVAVAYSAVLALALRSRGRGGRHRRDPVLLVLVGPMVFVLAGATGPPTALRPGAMLLNAAVLAAAAVILLVAVAGLVVDAGRADRTGVLALLALLLGSAGWLTNLVARWAVVLSGASGLQAQVEARAWMANVYLRGLGGPPDFVSLLLVWMDLLQVVYVILGYVSLALVAAVAVRRRLLSRRAGVLVAVTAAVLAGLLLISAALAAWVGPVSTITAGTAFVLSIPFMTTLVPYLLGAAALGRRT